MSTDANNQQPLLERSLTEWQQLGLQHFASLSAERKGKGTVFALEHNYTVADLQIIRPKLLFDFATTLSISKYWLLWVIYATEHGYRYKGEEYWPSFKVITPPWEGRHREELRLAFNEFHRRFQGVELKGSWATHFHIIALPITHAIIPRDIQVLLAKVLYENRYQIDPNATPDEIGEMLQLRSHHIHSTRFQNFLEHPELAGQIATTLLENNKDNQNFLYSATLQRIVKDLERTTNARYWIQAVRDVKSTLKGVKPAEAVENVKPVSQRHTFTHYNKTPELVAQVTLKRQITGEWAVIVDLPNLSSLLTSRQLVDSINRTRFKVIDTDVSWSPAISLTARNVQKKLNAWPKNGRIVSFEHNDPFLKLLEGSECNIALLEPRVFKVDAALNAYQIKTNQLRPGHEYVIVMSVDHEFPEGFLPALVTCDKVKAFAINVSSHPDEAEIEKLNQIGLVVSRTVQIAPIGIPARYWDGDGATEWLTTESPCFVIQQDRVVSGYQLEISGNQLTIGAKPPGVATYFKLAPLPVGQHMLKLTTLTNGVAEAMGIVEINVRLPVPWIPSISTNRSFSVSVEPNLATLDDLFANRVRVHVHATQSTTAWIQLSLLAGNEQLYQLGPKEFSLPVDQQQLLDFARSSLQKSNIEMVNNMQMTISIPQLGRQTVYFKRVLTPLRWNAKVVHSEHLLQLVDESVSTEVMEVNFFDVENPSVSTVMQGSWHEWRSVKSRGLFNIRKGGKSKASIVVSNIGNKHQLDALKITPRLPGLGRNRALDFSKWQSVARMWYAARAVDLVSMSHRQKVVDSFLTKVIAAVCGDTWPHLELSFMANQIFKAAVSTLSTRVGPRGLVDPLRDHFFNLQPDQVRPDVEKNWFIDLAIKHNITNNRGLAFFAIQLATNPLIIEDEQFGHAYTTNVNLVMNNQMLMRLARFHALCVSRIVAPDKPDYHILPVGLRWS